MKKTAAVVVTYNRIALLLENIQCLRAQSAGEGLDIVIINNASTDGTEERLKPLADRGEIIYINTGANLGGAGGFQYGIRYAAEHGYDYVWVMDDDCMPTETALEELLKADAQLGGSYGFLSSQVRWKDGEICAMNVQRGTVTKNVTDFTSPRVPVAMASFVSLFLPARIVWELGLPIKEFFIWTDDWEYTRRISRKYPCYLINDSKVVHKSASNIGAFIANDSEDRLDRYNYLYRNDVYLYRREGFKGFCYEAARLSVHTLKVLLKAKSCKGRRVKTIWKGTAAGKKFHPAIEFPERAEQSSPQQS